MYQLVMFMNVHHELTTLYVYTVDRLNDTGAHTLDEILAKIETGTDFAVKELIPIYDAYCVADVGDGTSAKLRDAIGLRLEKAQKEPVVIDTDSE